MGQCGAGWVVPLPAFGRRDVGRAGGKGASLGELARARFPVPAGFVVTTAAYQAFLRHSGLVDLLADLLAEAPDGSAARAAVRAAPLPPGLDDLLRRGYANLAGPAGGAAAVAVRSSATAEDLPTAAFAGQHETYLHVVGADDLVGAVVRCWASLWTERAVAYRRRRGAANPDMAVVVQHMVLAESAGVLFTANPVTGAREIVIDAGTGPGEAVVAGLMTPDHVVVDRRSGRFRSRRPVHAGTLGPAELRRLARLGAAVERHFGAPQDIEWAWAGGQPYLLQARPVTALPAPPPGRGYPRAAAGLIAEVIPVRPYPLDVTTWLASLLKVMTEVSARIGLRVSVADLLVEENGVVVRLNPPTMRPTWRILLLPARLWRWPWRPERDGADDALLADIDAVVRELRGRDLAAADWPELLATLRAACVVPDGVVAIRLRRVPDAVSLLWLWLVLALLHRTERFGELVSGTDNKTAETKRALDALAARVRADPTLTGLFAVGEPSGLLPVLADRAPEFVAELRAFLDRYGHRETASPLLATQPTWRDAPEVVLGLLRARAARPAPAAPAARPAWQVARDELLDRAPLRFPPARRAILRWLESSRRVFQAREDSRFHLTRALPVVRATMLELGRRLRAVGVVDEPEDVFHLRLEELDLVSSWPPPPALAAELRARVTRRAAARAALAGIPLVDPSAYTAAGPVDALLRGTPSSPGIAAGPARIVLDGAHFDRLRTGDVLVTPYTNPAWTPLFDRAAAVVVDTGGMMSHAAIVAREYGLPAVMATGDGTRRLADGQPVRVDGTRGLVLPA